MAQIVWPLCVLVVLILALFTNYKVIAILFYLACLVSVTINSSINQAKSTNLITGSDKIKYQDISITSYRRARRMSWLRFPLH